MVKEVDNMDNDALAPFEAEHAVVIPAAEYNLRCNNRVQSGTHFNEKGENVIDYVYVPKKISDICADLCDIAKYIDNVDIIAEGSVNIAFAVKCLPILQNSPMSVPTSLMSFSSYQQIFNGKERTVYRVTMPTKLNHVTMDFFTQSKNWIKEKYSLIPK